MDLVDRISGAEKLIKVFGYWPTFHDAEVIWIKLDRRPCDGEYGPTFEAMIHVFEMTSELDPSRHYVLRQGVLVHICCRELVESRFEGFNNQNVLFELLILDISERNLENIHFEVHFNSSYGLDASFQCKTLEIISVTPCDKASNPWAV